MRDVLLHATIRAGADLESGVQHALGLAASQGARVTALLSEVEPRSVPFAPPDNMQGGTQPPREVPRTEEAECIASLIRATAMDQGVPCEVLVSDAEAPSAGA